MAHGVTGTHEWNVRGCLTTCVTFRSSGEPLMIKPYVFTALLLGVAPLAALADPMSVGSDGNLLAAASTVTSASAGGGGTAMSDPADPPDDDVREPLATPETAAPRNTRQQPDTAHPPGRHAPAHAGNAAHRKTDTTRWQSLLPGVMK
jgi:hypothetical protein